MTGLMLRVVTALLLGMTLGACTPDPPPVDDPPEPQVMAQDTELRDVIQTPIDRAKAVEVTVSAAAEQQKAAIDAAAQ